jgi:hypothetical protein
MRERKREFMNATCMQYLFIILEKKNYKFMKIRKGEQFSN